MQLQHPKVSILMPSLNSVAFIRECMDSVVNQTLQEIEIICVDAGSTDGTLEILKEYERKDSRIRIIISDKKSMGYQYNLGLDAATGEYVGMVETDDWIELNTFESLWTTANKQDVDIVAANQYLYHTKPEVYNHPFENLSKCPYERVFCPRDVLQSFAVKPLIWSAIYRRSMLKENSIRFNETPGASFQDISFHFMVMTVAKTAFFLDRYFYHYRSDSETQSVHSDGKVYCMCDEARYYEQFLEHRPADKLRLLKPFVTWIYDKYFWNFIRIAPCFQWEFLMQFRKELLRYRQAGLLNESPSNTSGYNTFRKGFHEIIDNPVDFYKKYCKKYCTCPTAEKLPTPKLIRESQTETPDISIIIPLCNEENRIAVSLESAQKQTLENIEIVCVDDGSDDATLKKVMERAEADSRFTVLHQDNRGSGSAKNRGLEYARGKYVLFLYGGDRLREDAAERLVFLADKNGLDMVAFDFVSISEKDKENQVSCKRKSNAEEVKTGADYFCSSCEDNCYKPFAYTALYNRNYLMYRSIHFNDVIFYEDRSFMFSALTGADRVIHLERKLYFTGESRNLPLKKFFLRVYSYFVIYQEILKQCQSLPVYNERLQRNATGELKEICACLRDLYRAVTEKEECRSKFSSTELNFFDKLIDHKADF